MQNLLIKCSRCLGTGIDDNPKNSDGVLTPISCANCQGTGFVSGGSIDDAEIISELDICKKRLKK